MSSNSRRVMFILGLLLIAVAVIIPFAFGQSLIGGQASRWMTQEQIEACSHLFDRKVDATKEVPCSAIKDLWVEYCAQ